MSRRIHLWLMFALIAVVLQSAAGQQPVPKAAPPGTKSPSAPPKSTPPPATKTSPAAKAAPPATAPLTDAAKKQEILESQQWRRAMFELNEWLSAQQIYDQKQVVQIKSNMTARVAQADAAELQSMLDDLNAKFQVIDTPEAQEARAWMGQYLSVLSKKKRDEVLKSIPNVATMTAAQLNQEMIKIEQKQDMFEKEQAMQQRMNSQVPVNPFGRSSVGAQAYVQDHSAGGAAYSSPYRPASSGKPFDDVPIGPSMQIYSGWGGAGVVISPSNW